jgi:hypothetical protein
MLNLSQNSLYGKRLEIVFLVCCNFSDLALFRRKMITPHPLAQKLQTLSLNVPKTTSYEVEKFDFQKDRGFCSVFQSNSQFYFLSGVGFSKLGSLQ